MNSFFRKLSWLAQRRRKEAELREELQFHLEEEAEEHQAEGSAEEAKWAARRELGNVALLQENTRAAWGWTFGEQLIQDLRYALRAMINNPAFNALAVLSLALGIGANTAIYSFMDSILLRSLPVSNPESLVVLNWRSEDWIDGRNLPISGVRAFSEVRHALFERVRVLSDTKSEPDGERTGRAGQRRVCFRGLFSWTRRASRCRARDYSGRRSRWSSGDRCPELRVQSKAIRQRNERARAIHLYQ
jgi:hypothetical protein